MAKIHTSDWSDFLDSALSYFNDPKVTICASAYPHILDNILGHVDPATLRTMRLLSHEQRNKVDKFVFQHLVYKAKERKGEGGKEEWDMSISSVNAQFTVCTIPTDQYQKITPPSQSVAGVSLSWVTGVGGMSPQLPMHRGWAHTRVLDTDVDDDDEIFNTLLPPVAAAGLALNIVRRRRGHFYDPIATTVLDMLWVPPESKKEAQIRRLGDSTGEHVLLILYDPKWDGLTDMGAEMRRTAAASGGSTVLAHGVVIFRPTPAGEHLLSAPRDRSEPCSLLSFWLDIVVNLVHPTYTLVGLEEYPAHLLAAELGLSEPELEFAATDKATWNRTVAERTLDRIRPKWTTLWADAVEERIEVLSMDEYHARVGDEYFRLTTFSNGIPPHMTRRDDHRP